MATGGGTQEKGPGPPLDPAWQPGQERWPAELDMCAAAQAGQLLELTTGLPDLGHGPAGLSAMQAWGPAQTIRAAVLKHLLTGGEWQAHSRGVRLRGATIIGQLDLEASALGCPLRLENCYLPDPHPASFTRASVSWLTLADCRVAGGLTGDRLAVTRDLDLSGCVFDGPVVLTAADIGGNLDCTAAHLNGTDHEGCSLSAEGIKVGGRLRLNAGFTAASTIGLRGAIIAANLNCREAQLNGLGNALYADAIKVGGDAFLERMVTSRGALDLRGGDIHGNLELTGAHLNGANAGHQSLYADGTKIGGRLRLNAGFISAHTIWLRGASITANLNCRLAQLSGQENALYADAARIGGDAFLDNLVVHSGAINLLDTHVGGVLGFTGTQLNGVDSQGNSLFADGIIVGGDARLNQGFTTKGAVYLLDADIAGTLNCRSARLGGANQDGNALFAERMKVGSEVFLDSAPGMPGFTALGTVWLSFARITGQLACRGARLVPPKGRNALHAERLKVGGDVYLDTYSEGGRFLASGAILLTNADIAGNVSCAGAWLTIPDDTAISLTAEGLRVGGNLLLNERFTAAGAMYLPDARIGGSLNCCGAQLLGANLAGDALDAQRATVVGEALLCDGFRANGTIWLADADIGINLNCIGARLDGRNDDGDAFYGGGMKVGGALRLDGAVAAGAVDLTGASITANLNCIGARLRGANSEGALVADKATVGGHVLLRDGFTADGAIYLLDASVAGMLNCRGAQLNGRNSNGDAFYAERVKVGGNVFMETLVAAAGTVNFLGADITGSLKCSGAQLRAGGCALYAERMKVGSDVILDGLAGPVQTQPLTAAGSIRLAGARISGKLRWAPAAPVDHDVDLADANVGQLEDDWHQAHGCWPTGGRLHLEGFSYGNLSGDHPASVGQRLEWLRSQWPQHGRPEPAWTGTMTPPREIPLAAGLAPRFATQPYEQLAHVYQQIGQDTEARAIAVARRRDLRRYGNLSWYRRTLNWLLDWTIQYGYQTWRAVLLLAAVYLISVAVFVAAQHHPGLIMPVMDTSHLRPAPTALDCTSTYPCFYPAGYAIDTVIPIINVHQSSYWAPNGGARLGTPLVVFTWVGTLLGWALATLAVAGYTGLVRSSDAI
ncbi:MAG TPA: hypothetical protein VIX86_02230 [Streptosporangiaceae bacterium]